MKKTILAIIMSTVVIPSLSPAAAWDVSSSVDEMTGQSSAYATSPTVTATKEMSFPYKKTTSWVGVGCNSKSEWAFIGFTNSPNIIGDTTRDGYNLIETRVKWDNTLENHDFTQTWGSKFMHFMKTKAAITNTMKASEMKLELNWHGQGPVYFKYPLTGSTKAINGIRKICGRK